MKKILNRKLNFSFEKTIPKHWLGSSIFKSHLLNSFTLIFPTGEKFFIRSINQFFRQIEDPKLREDVKAFIRQESQHASEHEKFFTNLKEQGYEIESLIKTIDFIVKKFLEPAWGAKMNLSTTAGLEHFTALLAEIGLKENFLEKAHPKMKELFEWHAAEEIEHRSVAFDVLQAVDDSYALRVAGLANAYIMLFGLTSLCTLYLIYQDKKILNSKVVLDTLDTLFVKEALFFKSISICLRYLKPNFHPDQNEVDDLIHGVFGLKTAQEIA